MITRWPINVILQGPVNTDYALSHEECVTFSLKVSYVEMCYMCASIATNLFFLENLIPLQNEV